MSSVHTSDLSDWSIDNSDTDKEQVVPGSPVPEQTWSSQLNDVHLEEFQQPVGAVHDLAFDSPAIDFFTLLFEEEMFQLIAAETNRYAAEKQQTQPDSRWFPCTADEIRAYFGVELLMGIHKLPSYRMYWSEEEMLKVDYIKRVMSRTRYALSAMT